MNNVENRRVDESFFLNYLKRFNIDVKKLNVKNKIIYYSVLKKDKLFSFFLSKIRKAYTKNK